MWDQRYAGEKFAYGTEPNDFLREHAAGLPVGETLCIGEGEGRNAVFLAALGHRVTAVDASAVGLAKANRLAAERGLSITTRHCDLAHFEFEPARWDTIVSIFCHLPGQLRERVHRVIPAALKPGGVLILEAYTPRQLEFATGGPPVDDMMMELDGLRRELAGLDFIHGIETIREVIEGDFHTGTGAVVQVIARRSE